MNHSGQLETNYLPAQQLELNSVLNPLCKFEFKICKRDSTYFIRFAYVSYKHVRYKPILATDSDQTASDFQPAQQSELLVEFTLQTWIQDLHKKFDFNTHFTASFT